MFSKLRSKPQSQDRMTASKSAPSPSMHKQRASAATPKSASQSAGRKPSFSEHQWDERHWTKPFASGTTKVMATLHFPPAQEDHDLRRIPEEDDLYGKAQEHSHYKGSPKTSPAASKKGSASPSPKHSVSSRKTSASSMAKSSASSLKSTAPSTKSTSTITSKASASSLWSERPSSSSSNATYATSWSVDSSASTVMTDLDEPISECNSNRPDSCTLGDYDVFKLRGKKSHPKRPNSTVSSCSGTSCAGTIHSRPRTGKSSKTSDIAFQVVAEEADAIYLSPNPRPSRRWG